MALADERSQAKARGDLPMTRNSIADAVEKAAPGVVNITIYSHHQPTSSGSGFLIDPSGLVVTNAHVVAHVSRHSSITVTLENGQKYEATVHSFDTKADLALVQLNDPPATKLPTVAIGTSSSVRAGEWVIALGSPLSLQNSVSAGIISATARRGSELGFAPSHRTEFLQTDAAINVGNSGGPLVNLDGQVIGINTMKVAGGISGISFAIPIDGGMQVINQLRQHRTVTRPYVGMQMVEFGGTILPDIAKLYPSIPQGVVVKSVARGSPAEQAGLLPGDVIIEFAGSKVTSIKDVVATLGFSVGRKMCMKVLRGGRADQSHTVCFVTTDASKL